MSCKKPCKACPFARHCPPGETGGAPATVYVGQAHAPMFLPCHMTAGYKADRNDTTNPQCAGAAIYRANQDALRGYPDNMKRALLVLPADPEGATGAFRTPEELLAHHTPYTVEACRAFLRDFPPALLGRMELDKVLSGSAGFVHVTHTEGG